MSNKLDKVSTFIVKACVILIILTLAAIMYLTPRQVKAGELPLWKQERTVAAAAPLCADNRGVYQIRPNAQGNYWLTCNDSTMIRVKIKVNKQAVALAKL